MNLRQSARVTLLPGLAECLGFLPGEVGENQILSSTSRIVESPHVADPNFNFKLLLNLQRYCGNADSWDMIVHLL